MKVSKQGIELLKQFEGLKLNAYLDSANIWTIGYGNTFYPDGRKVKKGDKITMEQAINIFPVVLNKFETGVNKLVTSNVNQNQFDAIVSLAYNIGLGALSRSSLLKKVNLNPNDPTIKNSFYVWNKAGGKKLKGLINRRLKEYEHYQGSTKSVILPSLLIFGIIGIMAYFYKI